MNTPASYADSPACKLVATNCAICARPLVDAKSVETGIGPECRRKHGVETAEGTPDLDAARACLAPIGAADMIAAEGEDDCRGIVNKLAYLVAAEQTGERAARMTAAIWHLGYRSFAKAIARRIGVIVEREVGNLIVRAPYSDTFGTALYERRAMAKWDGKRKVRVAPVSRDRAVMQAICATFGGLVLIGEKGAGVIAKGPKARPVHPIVAERAKNTAHKCPTCEGTSYNEGFYSSCDDCKAEGYNYVPPEQPTANGPHFGDCDNEEPWGESGSAFLASAVDSGPLAERGPGRRTMRPRKATMSKDSERGNRKLHLSVTHLKKLRSEKLKTDIKAGDSRQLSVSGDHADSVNSIKPWKQMP